MHCHDLMEFSDESATYFRVQMLLYPFAPLSRPNPDSFIPPNGAATSVTRNGAFPPSSMKAQQAVG